MRALIPLLCLLLALPAAAAESWPSFRRTPDLAGAVDVPVADQPRLAWTFDAKSGVQATAAIVDGRAYVGTLESGLLCLELRAAQKEGKELWRAKLEAAVLSSPAVGDGTVFAGDELGVLHAFDAATGAVRWRFDTREQGDGGGEIVSSVTLHGELALFGCYDSFLYAVRRKDGRLAWRYQTQAQVRSTPAVVGGLTFVAGCDAHVRAVDVATGKEAWALEIGDNCPGSPGIGGDRLVVGTLGQQVLCLDWKRRQVLWRYEVPDRKFEFWSSPAIGRVPGAAAEKAVEVAIIGGRDKHVHAIRLDDGKALWTFPTRAKVDASPVIVRDRVIAASYDGNLYVLDLRSGKEVWKFAAGGPFAASPAVADGRLVIGDDDGAIFCFDLQAASP